MLFQLTGFKPDLNESIAMMEKSNKCEFNMSVNLTLTFINMTLLILNGIHAVLPHPLTSLYIGKCYLHINKRDDTKKWLEDATNFKSSQALPEGTAHAYVSWFLYIHKSHISINFDKCIAVIIVFFPLCIIVKKSRASTTEETLVYYKYHTLLQ